MGDYPWSRGLSLTEESKLSWMDQKEVSPINRSIKSSIKHPNSHYENINQISPPFYPVSTPILIVDDDLSPSNKLPAMPSSEDSSNDQSVNQTKFPLSMFRRRLSSSSDDSNKSAASHSSRDLSKRTTAQMKQSINGSNRTSPALSARPTEPVSTAESTDETVSQSSQLPPLNPHPRASTNDRQQLYSTFTRSLEATDSDALLVKPLEGEFLPYHLNGERVCFTEYTSQSNSRSNNQLNNGVKREKSIFDRVILVVDTIVLTSPADTCGLCVGDWVVSIGDYNADNWRADGLDDVATLVREWPRQHRRSKLKIEVLRRVKGDEIKALPRNAQVVQARCMVASSAPPGSVPGDKDEPQWSFMTLNLQALTLHADINTWSMADVMSRDSGGVLGACLAPFPQPKSVRARVQSKPAAVKAVAAQAKYVPQLSHNHTIKPIHKSVQAKAKRVEEPCEAGWRRVTDPKNRRAPRKSSEHMRAQIASY